MSTEYGRALDKSGKIICVEAYGTTHTVKLQREDGSQILAFNDEVELEGLIVALELARDHSFKE